MTSLLLFPAARRARRLGPKWAAAAGPFKFGLVGLSGLVVDLAAFHVLLSAAPAGLARAGAIAVAMTWNFWLNRQFTFAGARSPRVVRQYVLYCLSCSLGAVVSWLTSMVLLRSTSLGAAHPSAVVAAGAVVGAASNYALCVRAVFRKANPAPGPVEAVRVEQFPVQFPDRMRAAPAPGPHAF